MQQTIEYTCTSDMASCTIINEHAALHVKVLLLRMIFQELSFRNPIVSPLRALGRPMRKAISPHMKNDIYKYLSPNVKYKTVRSVHV